MSKFSHLVKAFKIAHEKYRHVILKDSTSFVHSIVQHVLTRCWLIFYRTYKVKLPPPYKAEANHPLNKQLKSDNSLTMEFDC